MENGADIRLCSNAIANDYHGRRTNASLDWRFPSGHVETTVPGITARRAGLVHTARIGAIHSGTFEMIRAIANAITAAFNGIGAFAERFWG